MEIKRRSKLRSFNGMGLSTLIHLTAIMISGSLQGCFQVAKSIIEENLRNALLRLFIAIVVLVILRIPHYRIYSCVVDLYPFFRECGPSCQLPVPGSGCVSGDRCLRTNGESQLLSKPRLLSPGKSHRRLSTPIRNTNIGFLCPATPYELPGINKPFLFQEITSFSRKLANGLQEFK